MKTPSTIKTASSLFLASLLLSLSGHAQTTPGQNFNLSREFSTPNYNSSDYGSRARFSISDSYTLPQGATPYTYSVTAAGLVTGKIPGQTFTAANGTATVRLAAPNTVTLNANLAVAGVNIFNYSNQAIAEYESDHFIKEVKVGKAVPFVIPIGPFALPCTVDVRAKASMDACLRATATFSPTLTQGLTGLPRVLLSAGPEVDLAASAGASVGIGVPGFSLNAGIKGTITIAKTALKANVDLAPTLRFEQNGGIFVRRVGVNATANVTAQLPGMSGRLVLFVAGHVGNDEIPLGELTLARFSVPAPAPVTLLGPVTYRLF